MAAVSFWRKSRILWVIGVSMIFTGTGSALTYADEGRGVSLGSSIFAFSWAVVCAISIVVVWVKHRRSEPS